MAFKVKIPVMECGAHYDHKFRWWLQDENGQRVAAYLVMAFYAWWYMVRFWAEEESHLQVCAPNTNTNLSE